MRISDWSSDVCSSDLPRPAPSPAEVRHGDDVHRYGHGRGRDLRGLVKLVGAQRPHPFPSPSRGRQGWGWVSVTRREIPQPSRSEEHTSELQSLMRTSYAVFRLKKKNNKHTHTHNYKLLIRHTSH